MMDKDKLHTAAELLRECDLDLTVMLQDARAGLSEVNPSRSAGTIAAEEAREALYCSALDVLDTP